MKNRNLFLFGILFLANTSLASILTDQQLKTSGIEQIVCDENACPAGTTATPSSIPAARCGSGRFFACVKSGFNPTLGQGAFSWAELSQHISASAGPAPSYLFDKSGPTGGSGGMSSDEIAKRIKDNMEALEKMKYQGLNPNEQSAFKKESEIKRLESQIASDRNELERQRTAAIEADRDERSRYVEGQREQERDHKAEMDKTGRHQYRYNTDGIADSVADGSECSVSNTLTEGKGNCEGTRAVITGAQVTNFGSQIAGSVTTQIVGAGAQVRAANSQTQSGALRAAASTQDTTAKMQMGIGAVNSLLGVTQFWKSKEHSNTSKEIAAGTRKGRTHLDESGLAESKDMTGTGKGDQSEHGYINARANQEMAGRAIKEFNLNQRGEDLVAVTVTEQKIAAAKAEAVQTGNYAMVKQLEQQRTQQIEKRKQEANVKLNNMGVGLNQIGARGQAEQNKISNEAQAGGLLSFMTGAQQLVMGYFNKQGADQTKQAANQLEQAEQRAAMQAAAAFTPPRADSLASGDALGARAPSAITGNGVNSAPATDVQANQNPIDTTGTDGFGDSQSPENLANVPGAAPSPGAFDPNKGGGPVAQGGGGFAPGGNTSPNDNAGKEGPGATAYNDTAGKMETGGGGRGAAYSGGGGGGGGNPSINPADMLAQLGKLLPGQEDQNGAKKNTIEDYVNRSPAAAGTWVPQSESLFEHVSMAYRQQQKRKAVGI